DRQPLNGTICMILADPRQRNESEVGFVCRPAVSFTPGKAFGKVLDTVRLDDRPPQRDSEIASTRTKWTVTAYSFKNEPVIAEYAAWQFQTPLDRLAVPLGPRGKYA